CVKDLVAALNSCCQGVLIERTPTGLLCHDDHDKFLQPAVSSVQTFIRPSAIGCIFSPESQFFRVTGECIHFDRFYEA
ncbi:unnamed protein product, partial [Protopolystoma xenopodis]